MRPFVQPLEPVVATALQVSVTALGKDSARHRSSPYRDWDASPSATRPRQPQPPPEPSAEPGRGYRHHATDRPSRAGESASAALESPRCPSCCEYKSRKS